MLVAERIIATYQSREQSLNWSEWAETYPGSSRLLELAFKAYRKMYSTDGE